MGFGVFLCNAEIENMRIKNKAFFRYFKIFDLVVLFCINHMFFVSSQCFPKCTS